MPHEQDASTVSLPRGSSTLSEYRSRSALEPPVIAEAGQLDGAAVDREGSPRVMRQARLDRAHAVGDDERDAAGRGADPDPAGGGAGYRRAAAAEGAVAADGDAHVAAPGQQPDAGLHLADPGGVDVEARHMRGHRGEPAPGLAGGRLAGPQRRE